MIKNKERVKTWTTQRTYLDINKIAWFATANLDSNKIIIFNSWMLKILHSTHKILGYSITNSAFISKTQ
jgi:hypothetical protein